MKRATKIVSYLRIEHGSLCLQAVPSGRITIGLQSTPRLPRLRRRRMRYLTEHRLRPQIAWSDRLSSTTRFSTILKARPWMRTAIFALRLRRWMRPMPWRVPYIRSNCQLLEQVLHSPARERRSSVRTMAIHMGLLPPTTTFCCLITLSYEIDAWGKIRRMVPVQQKTPRRKQRMRTCALYGSPATAPQWLSDCYSLRERRTHNWHAF